MDEKIETGEERITIPRLLLGIVVRPTATLGYVRDNPKWLWLVPGALLGALLVINAVVRFPVTTRVSEEVMQEQLAQMPPEQRAQVEQFTREGSPFMMVGLVTGLVGGLIGLAVSWLFRAGVLHFVALALGGQGRFAQMFSVTAWARMPYVLRGILQAIYVPVTGKLIVPGLASLVAPADPLRARPSVTYALLSSIDLFVFWDLLLLAIGVAVVARFSRRKAAAITLGYWILTLILSLIPVFISRFFLPLVSTGPGP